jgi:hypothetical protein
MGNNFKVTSRKVKEGLHIVVSGDFDGTSAWELINTISRNYRGRGRVVIDTRNLGEVEPFGGLLFETLMDPHLVPRGRLMFTDMNRGRELLGDRSATSRQVDVAHAPFPLSLSPVPIKKN